LSSEHEGALIGRLLSDESQYPVAARILKADDFTLAPARDIWLVISEIYGKQEVNLQNVYLALSSKVTKEWLSQVTEWLVPGEVDAISHKIKNQARLTRLKQGLAEVQKHDDPDDLMSHISGLYRQEVVNTDKEPGISDALRRFSQIREFYREQGGIGHQTGYDTLDHADIVYQPGHLWVVGGNPSVGKTAYMVESLNRIKDANIAVFSLEMTEEQVISRILANLTGYSGNAILQDGLVSHHKQQVREAEQDLVSRNLWIYDGLNTTEEIVSQCRMLNMSHGLDVIFIDYIQKLNPGGGKQYEVQAEAADIVFNLAQEMRATAVVFSQINNEEWKQDSGILQFKGAGEWSANCDVGIRLKRDFKNALIKVDVRKNRHGPLKKMLLKFTPGFTGLEDQGEMQEEPKKNHGGKNGS